MMFYSLFIFTADLWNSDWQCRWNTIQLKNNPTYATYKVKYFGFSSDLDLPLNVGIIAMKKKKNR